MYTQEHSYYCHCRIASYLLYMYIPCVLSRVIYWMLRPDLAVQCFSESFCHSCMYAYGSYW